MHADRAVAHALLVLGVVLVAVVALAEPAAPRGRRRPAGGRVKRIGLLVALLVGLLLTGVGTAGPASAHATLVSTDPGEGARLDSSPDEVTLRVQRGRVPRRGLRAGR